MYKILGADLKEYGPITAEQVIQWINEGRLDGNSKVQVVGTVEWKALSTFPEFATALASKAARNVPPPAVTAANEEALVDLVLARGCHVDVVSCISRSWTLLLKNFWLLVGAVFVGQLVQGAVLLINGVVMGGIYILFLKLIRGQKAEFGDAFAGFSNLFLPLFLVGLVSSVLTSLGIICCILPGIFLAVVWLFAIPLAADRKMSFWTAMEVSRKVIQRHWWTFFLLAVLNIGVFLVGLLVCCVGVHVAYPITIGAIAYAYEDVFGAPTPATTQQV